MPVQSRNRLLWFGGIALTFLLICSAGYFFHREELFLLLLMLTPALSVVLTRMITREGAENLYLKPHFRGNIRWYVLAYVSPPLLAYAGAFVYFLLFPGRLDPMGSSLAVQFAAETPGEYLQQLAGTLPLAMLCNPMLGIIQCFGEEFAWRGYLFPKLCEGTSLPNAMLLTGAVWGLWHSPIVLMGFNYGTDHPVLGVLAMVCFCVVMGIMECWFFWKTDSIWPPVLFHAAVNGIDKWLPSNLLMSQPANPFLGPDATGLIGGIGFLAAALLLFFYMRKTMEKGVGKAPAKRRVAAKKAGKSTGV